MLGLHRLDQVVFCACLLEQLLVTCSYMSETLQLSGMVKDGGALTVT